MLIHATLNDVAILLQYLSIPNHDNTRLDLLYLFWKLIIKKQGELNY